MSYGGETGNMGSNVFKRVIKDEWHFGRGCIVATKRMATGTERELYQDCGRPGQLGLCDAGKRWAEFVRP